MGTFWLVVYCRNDGRAATTILGTTISVCVGIAIVICTACQFVGQRLCRFRREEEERKRRSAHESAVAEIVFPTYVGYPDAVGGTGEVSESAFEDTRVPSSPLILVFLPGTLEGNSGAGAV